MAVLLIAWRRTLIVENNPFIHHAGPGGKSLCAKFLQKEVNIGAAIAHHHSEFHASDVGTAVSLTGLCCATLMFLAVNLSRFGGKGNRQIGSFSGSSWCEWFLAIAMGMIHLRRESCEHCGSDRDEYKNRRGQRFP